MKKHAAFLIDWFASIFAKKQDSPEDITQRAGNGVHINSYSGSGGYIASPSAGSGGTFIAVSSDRAAWKPANSHDFFVSRIENAIETNGVSHVFEAVLQAVQNIESERLEETDNEEFYESQEYKNLQHCKTIIEHVMSACDLDITYGYAEARKVAMERFEEAMKDELPNTLREQG